jgi:hypothetical protein
MRATIAITLLFFAVTACVQSVPTVEEPPPDAGPEPEPEACPTVIACDADNFGAQVRGISNQCFECVRTSEPRAPYAWTTVAPCSIPPLPEDGGQ